MESVQPPRRPAAPRPVSQRVRDWVVWFGPGRLVVGASSVLSVGNLADLAPAQGVENGALFVFAMPGAFVLDSHSSALVPIMDKPVKTENIAFFASAGGTARAAVRFVNTTGQTLPAGTLAVFGSGGFAGETALDRLKPGDRRFLQVGNDLDAEVTTKTSDRTEESKRLTFKNGRLEEHFLATTKYGWELENRGGAARTFYVTLSAEKNATVTGTDRVDFDEATSHPIVVFDAPAKSKALRNFVVTEGLSRANTIDMLSSKQVHDLLAKTTIPAAELAILSQAEPRIRALEAEHAKAKEADKVAATAQGDLERLREHMKALGGGEKGAGAGGGTAAAPLVKRVLEAEDLLQSARKTKEATAKELEKKREAVRETLSKLGSRGATRARRSIHRFEDGTAKVAVRASEHDRLLPHREDHRHDPRDVSGRRGGESDRAGDALQQLAPEPQRLRTRRIGNLFERVPRIDERFDEKAIHCRALWLTAMAA